QVPNLVRALVADAALSSAFVPVFTELQEKGERQRAWRVASSLFWLVLLVLTALTALFIVIAPWVIGLFGDPGGDRQLAIGLSRVLFPIVALLGVSGVVAGILNSYERFTVPALSPAFWTLAQRPVSSIRRSRRPRSPRRFASTCSRRGASPLRSRPCSFRRSRASQRATPGPGSAAPLRAAFGRSRSSSFRRASSARSWPN